MVDKTRPPVIVNVDDVEPIIRHPKGGGTDYPLICNKTAGTDHILMGYCTYAPGKGSQWHSHEEEDVFFIVNGRGTIFYKKDGKEHSMPIKAGDAIFSGYLENYVINSGEETLVIVYAISPKDRYEKPE